MSQLPYQNIRVVLVNPSHPGNIGGVARAMKNMCLSRLYVVASPQHVLASDARARAVSALDVLEQAVVVDTLDEAIAECSYVVGASARLRTIPWPTYDPHVCAQQVVTLAHTTQVALVFGREDTGLHNDELEKCQSLVYIPANADYSSLNLAAAVQVLVYEIHMASLAMRGEHVQLMADNPLATAAELEGLYQHFQATLTHIQFYDPNNPKQLFRRLRRLFNRAQLDRMELNILRGILNAVDNKTKRD